MLRMKRKKMFVVAVLSVVGVLVLAGAAFAFGTSTSPVGASLRTLIVDDIIAGPIGSAAGAAFVVVGAVMACMGKISGAIWPLIGGGMLATASSIATSLGMAF